MTRFTSDWDLSATFTKLRFTILGGKMQRARTIFFQKAKEYVNLQKKFAQLNKVNDVRPSGRPTLDMKAKAGLVCAGCAALAKQAVQH